MTKGCSFCGTLTDHRGGIRFDSRGRASFYGRTGIPLVATGAALNLTSSPAISGQRTLVVTPVTGAVRSSMDRGAAMRTQGCRGFTLLETVIAMSVLLIGAMGMLGLHTQGLRMEGDARRITRATAIAQGLMGAISLWPWGDPRLGGPNPPLDSTMLATLGDPAYAFERASPPTASFSDATGGLTQGGTTGTASQSRTSSRRGTSATGTWPTWTTRTGTRCPTPPASR